MSHLATNSPDPVLDWFTDFETGGARNLTGWSNPKVDAALLTTRSSSDEKALQAAYDTVQTELIADIPVVYYMRWIQARTS